jgi:hypothetical protein
MLGLKTDLVLDENFAVQLGEILCEALYGDLALQAPLFATDSIAYWRVEGSRNRDGAINGTAEFFLSLEKSDGRVADIGEHLRFPPHPSVVPMINEHFARAQAREPEQKSSGQLDVARKEDGNTITAESGNGMLLLTSIARGGVVFSSDLALKIAELYCRSHFGDLQRQAPLTAADKESYWRVEGNWNRDRKVKGAGPFFISIEKYGGRVMEIGE